MSDFTDETLRNLDDLNEVVMAAAESSDPVFMNYDGHPDVRIDLKTSTFEYFGRFRDRAPHVVGKFIMRGVMNGSITGAVRPAAVFRQKQTYFGEFLTAAQMDELSCRFDLGFTWQATAGSGPLPLEQQPATLVYWRGRRVSPGLRIPVL